MTPIYTAENCVPAYQLDWSYGLFWKTPPGHCDWFPELQAATEPDGVRLLQHRFSRPNVSQFLVSTKPDVVPLKLAASIKGRLQYLVRQTAPKAFRRNYSLRSVGSTKRVKLENYLELQLDHHPMADERVQQKLGEYQIHQADVDLSAPRYTSHAQFLYNLHLVLANESRWMEISDEVLTELREMVLRASQAKKHLLSRAAILPDHIHMTLGCRPDEPPLDVALGYMNNLAHACGMRPIFSFGCFMGTFGEYDLGVVPRETPQSSAPPGQARRGRREDVAVADSAESISHRDKPGGETH